MQNPAFSLEIATYIHSLSWCVLPSYYYIKNPAFNPAILQSIIGLKKQLLPPFAFMNELLPNQRSDLLRAYVESSVQLDFGTECLFSMLCKLHVNDKSALFKQYIPRVKNSDWKDAAGWTISDYIARYSRELELD